MTDQLELESVDMSWPREEITTKIMEQLKTLGFFSLTNIPGYNEEELERACKWLFNLSEEEKRKMNQNHHNP